MGRTINSRQRCGGHISGARKGYRTHKDNWIRQLLSEGVEPVIEPLEYVPESKWEEAEKFWIESLRQLGFKLTNATRGGEGIAGAKLSPETIAQREATRRRQNPNDYQFLHTPQAVAKTKATKLARGVTQRVSQQSKDRWKDPAYRAKIVASIRARGKDPAWREKVRQATAKALRNPEIRLRLSTKSKARWQQPEYRARVAAKMAEGRACITSEAKLQLAEKRRVAISAAWCDPEKRERMMRLHNDPEVRARTTASIRAAWDRRRAEGKAHWYKKAQVAL